MATFNTVEELVRILDEDPRLLEALRSRLLTRELLALPATHAAFVAEMREFVAASNQRFEAIELRLDKMSEDITELRQDVTGMDGRLTTIEGKVTTIDEKVTGIDRRVIRLGNDFGTFRGSYAESAARKRVGTIALSVANANGIDLDDFTVRTLDSDALKDKARTFAGLSDIPQGDRFSFYESDLVAEVQDLEGETYYIVVEASYTCDETDTARAIAHAKLLTKFTRKNAYPVVAGVCINNEIRETVESGDVFWHRIEDNDLKPI